MNFELNSNNFEFEFDFELNRNNFVAGKSTLDEEICFTMVNFL